MREQVLNPTLYDVLRSRFGEVLVGNSGMPAQMSYTSSRGERRVHVTGGEYYRIRCPRCHDHTPRLWVSYLFGTYDRKTDQQILHAAICYHCGATAFDGYLVDMLRPSLSKLKVHIPVEPLNKPPEVEAVALPPGEICRLDDLPARHPARAYMESRNFDCSELSEQYGWRYCFNSTERFIDKRIFIPVFHEKDDGLILAGYQCRAIPEHSTCSSPKYWTLPGFSKSCVLYNLQNAKTQDIVVITEGPTDAARVGIAGVSLFGKSISLTQVALILENCSESRVAVMLDSDAYKAAVGIEQKLAGGAFGSKRLGRGAFLVSLGKGDPGDYTREELWNFINHSDQLDKVRRTSGSNDAVKQTSVLGGEPEGSDIPTNKWSTTWLGVPVSEG